MDETCFQQVQSHYSWAAVEVRLKQASIVRICLPSSFTRRLLSEQSAMMAVEIVIVCFTSPTSRRVIINTVHDFAKPAIKYEIAPLVLLNRNQVRDPQADFFEDDQHLQYDGPGENARLLLLLLFFFFHRPAALQGAFCCCCCCCCCCCMF